VIRRPLSVPHLGQKYCFLFKLTLHALKLGHAAIAVGDLL
jgi:hypothetical protein